MTSYTKKTLLAACVPVALAMLIIPSVDAQNARPQGGARPQVTVGSQNYTPTHDKFTDAQIEAGGTAFLQNCAFCHGKDTSGGESGPDLTRSKLVAGDKGGEAIGAVVRSGRPEKGMPRFTLPDTEILNIVAFIHTQRDKAMSQSGNRKGVDEADLLTGNKEAGKKYFEGAGGCTKCHSENSLKGIATRLQGLQLEMQMLSPRNVKSKVSVKTREGKTLDGTLEYKDEFTIGMKDAEGVYHSWPTKSITYKVDSPVDAHVELFSKYTDEDIHNLFAYIQSLK